LGSRELIEACRLNDCPNMSIGRSMKTGKEEIIGLVKAVELYVAQDHSAVMSVWERRVAYIINALSTLEHVRVWRQLPYGIGQQIPHDSDGVAAPEVRIHPHTLREGEEVIVARWLREELSAAQ
jgi:L-seryl-tRNA(Ser) seleniumtransferase